MRRVEVTTFLDAPPDAIWEAVQKPGVFAYVSAPLIRFAPLEPPALPEHWSEGGFRVKIRFLGSIPLGAQWIRVSLPEPEGDVRFVRDNGSGTLATRWDHLISIAPEGQGTRYTDRVDIDAGWLTAAVAGFAWMFYTHRQRRWRALVAAGLELPRRH